MFFLVIQLKAMELSGGANGNIFIDPERQQQDQDYGEKRKETIRRREESTTEYIKRKEKIAQKLQRENEALEKRIQEGNEMHYQRQRELHEESIAIKRKLNEATKESNEKNRSAIIGLMKAHEKFMKAKQIPFIIRKKLIIEYTLDDIRGFN